jgi:hypothetical protein
MSLKLSALVVCVIGFTTGVFLLRPSPPSLETISVEPAVLSAIQPVVEGSSPTFHFVLQNRSSHRVQILSVHKSCGCLSVKFGEPGDLPIVVEPSTAIPFEVAVNTKGKFGQTEDSVALSVTADGHSVEDVGAKIRLSVLATLRAIPEAIVCESVKPGSECRAEVTLVDGFDASTSASTMPELSTSSSQGMSAQCEKESGTMDVSGNRVQRRFKLKVQFTAPTDRSSRRETILVKPAGSTGSPIVIPVVCHVQADVMCYPDAISIIDSAPSKKVDANVACVTMKDTKNMPELEAPPGVAVEIRRVGPRMFQLSVKCQMPARPGLSSLGKIHVRFPELPASASIPIVLKLE